eukprot:919818-Prorocentrum_minimum.AAC.2
MDRVKRAKGSSTGCAPVRGRSISTCWAGFERLTVEKWPSRMCWDPFGVGARTQIEMGTDLTVCSIAYTGDAVESDIHVDYA